MEPSIADSDRKLFDAYVQWFLAGMDPFDLEQAEDEYRRTRVDLGNEEIERRMKRIKSTADAAAQGQLS